MSKKIMMITKLITLSLIIMGITVITARGDWQNFDIPGEQCTAPVSIDAENDLAAVVDEETGRLYYYDFNSRQSYDTGIDVRSSLVCLKGNYIVYQTRTDGSYYDVGISVYDIVSGTITDTGITSADPRYYWDSGQYFNGEYIVYTDRTDWRVKIYSLTTGAITDTGITGYSPTIDGNFVAFSSPEWEIGLYDITTQQVKYVGIGDQPIVGGNIISYIDDTDRLDELKYYEIDSDTIISTGILDIERHDTDGNRILFNVREYSLAVLDVASGTVHYTEHHGCGYSDPCWVEIAGDYIAYERYEGGTNGPNGEVYYPPTDYNGDGEIGDCVALWFKFPLDLVTTIDIEPNTVNVDSNVRYITSYIGLSEGYDVRDIDMDTVLLNRMIPAVVDPKYGFTNPEESITDHDQDVIPELMVKFDMADVIAVFEGEKEIELLVTGIVDGALFVGRDTIRILAPNTGPGPGDEEFLVNTYTKYSQNMPTIAMNDRGNSVVTWRNGYSSINAQMYDARGKSLGWEFKVNTYPYGNVYAPDAAIDESGNFVIVWRMYSGYGSGVYAQRYNADGTPAGSEFQVSASGYSTDSPAVAMDADSDFVITWSSYYDEGIYARMYDSSGNPVGSEFRVNMYPSPNQHSPDIAMDNSGNFVITWQGYDGSGSHIYAQRYNADGTSIGSNSRVDTSGAYAYEPTVAMDPEGNSVIAWQRQDGSGYGVYARQYDSAGDPMGSEFRANTYTNSDQIQPAVAMETRRLGFVIAWSSYSQDGDRYGVYAQKYDLAGTPVGSEFQVNTYTDYDQYQPAIAMDGKSNFVVVWSSYSPGSSYYDIFAKRYTVTGSDTHPPVDKPGPGELEIQVNTYTDSEQSTPTTAMDDRGNSVVAWSSYYQDGSGWGIYAQRYDQRGNAVGSEFRVNTYTNSDQYYPDVAMDDSGNFVIVWYGYGSYGYGIYAQRYNADGTPAGPEFEVNTSGYSAYQPAVAMNDNGNFVVTWYSYRYWPDYYDIYARMYDSSGTPVSSEFRVNTYTSYYQYTPDAAMDDSGSFVIVWYGNGSSGYGIYAQRYNADGTPAGSEFRVDTPDLSAYDPAVAMDPQGNSVIAWQSYGSSGNDIYAQLYDSAGNLVGSEFQVNTYTDSNQEEPTIAMDDGGNFVVAWSSYYQDGSGSGVYAQKYDSTGALVGSEFQVNTYIESDQYQPAIAIDGRSDFMVAWASYYQDGSGRGIFAKRYSTTGPNPAPSVEEEPISITTELEQNYPNPFNPESWIPYRLREDTEVVIRIHDAAGRLVRTLDLGLRAAGAYTGKDKAAYWDGRNEVGERVASGLYFYSIQAGNFIATRKMVVKK